MPAFPEHKADVGWGQWGGKWGEVLFSLHGVGLSLGGLSTLGGCVAGLGRGCLLPHQELYS